MESLQTLGNLVPPDKGLVCFLFCLNKFSYPCHGYLILTNNSWVFLFIMALSTLHKARPIFHSKAPWFSDISQCWICSTLEILWQLQVNSNSDAFVVSYLKNKSCNQLNIPCANYFGTRVTWFYTALKFSIHSRFLYHQCLTASEWWWLW